jgi:hypothetical protein
MRKIAFTGDSEVLVSKEVLFSWKAVHETEKKKFCHT